MTTAHGSYAIAAANQRNVVELTGRNEFKWSRTVGTGRTILENYRASRMLECPRFRFLMSPRGRSVLAALSYSSHFFDRLIAHQFRDLSVSLLRAIILLERRKAVRHRTFKGASIEFGGGAIDCTVRNLSEKGATLDVASSLGIPDKFNLHVKGDHIHKCRLVWRKEMRIGVEFD